jgi:hypothetical protein
MSHEGHQLLQSLGLLFKCDSCCPTIGSLQSSLVYCMSHLKFNYLEPEIIIIHSNWDVILWYRLSLKKLRKEGKKKISQNINHQDLVFGICISYIQWMNKCSMMSSMINEYVFLRVFYSYFPHNLCGVYIWLESKQFIYFSLVYIFEGIYSYIFYVYYFYKEEILYIKGVNFMVMHARGSWS